MQHNENNVHMLATVLKQFCAHISDAMLLNMMPRGRLALELAFPLLPFVVVNKTDARDGVQHAAGRSVAPLIRYNGLPFHSRDWLLVAMAPGRLPS
jgi:hypothetical protein